MADQLAKNSHAFYLTCEWTLVNMHYLTALGCLLLPLQIRPSPCNPSRQLHSKLPLVLVQ